MPEDREKQKDEAWENGNALMNEIRENGGFSDHVQKNKELASGAFSETVSCACCMDGRITMGGVRAAGVGLLLGPLARERFIRKLKAAGVTLVTRHPDCGAEERYIAGRKKKGVKRAVAEKEIEHWFGYLGRRLGGEVGKAAISSEFHNERVIYYDFTGTFNPAEAPGVFPPGFVITRKYLGGLAATKDAELGVEIAKGDRGFGARFSKKHPLIVVIVAENRGQLARGHLELAGLHARSVRVEEFIKPKF